MREIPRLGRYRHFKGGLYELIAVAKNSEKPEELFAVYRALYGNGEHWIRPLRMWDELVECNGSLVKRFEYIEQT